MADNAKTTEQKTEAQVSLAPLPDGTVLEYAIADSGMEFPNLGLFLSPDADGIVGEDMDGLLAARFVENGTLRVVSPPQAEDESGADGGETGTHAGPVIEAKAEPETQEAAPAQEASAVEAPPPAAPPPAPPASLAPPAPEGPPANQGETPAA